MENIIVKIKISKEQAELFEGTGTRVVLSDKDVYMSIPYWLKETDEEYVYEYLMVEQLPDDIRNEQPRYSEEDLKRAYFAGVESTGEGWNGEYANGNCPDVEKEFNESFLVWFKNK